MATTTTTYLDAEGVATHYVNCLATVVAAAKASRQPPAPVASLPPNSETVAAPVSFSVSARTPHSFITTNTANSNSNGVEMCRKEREWFIEATGDLVGGECGHHYDQFFKCLRHKFTLPSCDDAATAKILQCHNTVYKGVLGRAGI
eukprot:Filipodium_phascolosomae@DN7338_c0_g1_i1.p1